MKNITTEEISSLSIDNLGPKGILLEDNGKEIILSPMLVKYLHVWFGRYLKKNPVTLGKFDPVPNRCLTFPQNVKLLINSH